MADRVWLPRGDVVEADMAESLIPALDGVLERYFGLKGEKLAPAAASLVARHGVVAYERAIGEALPETVFDLASVTKAVATAPLLMMLIDAGVLGLDRPVAEVISEWAGSPLERVSLRQLLAHRAGLWEWRPAYMHTTDPTAAIEFVLGLEPRYTPDTVRAYSDLGLIIAGEILRRATGQDISDQMDERIVTRLGLTRTAFRPDPTWRPEVAPTSRGDWYERRMVDTGQPYPVPERGGHFARWRDRQLVGETNDCNAFHAFGGAAGHAGLFATAHDLAVIGIALMREELVSRSVLDIFATEIADVGQGVIFQTTLLAGKKALWHPGFTGTRWLVCPDHDIVVVLLSNRLCVDDEPRQVDAAWEAVLAAVESSLVSR